MIIPRVRKDRWGSGEYKAPRGGRQHRGIDYAAYPGSILLSDFRGIVTRIGYPYAVTGPRSEYRLIELKLPDHVIVKYFYINPCVTAGDKIEIGQQLGTVQDLNKIYPGIESHYHIEVIKNGSRVNPRKFILEYNSF